ncbi:MAG TPA: hypothetical protein VN612_04295 [Acidobacteriaceae bacterium]|nr:hypothetical protein [Acidobacteriaceae bacterium]
MRTMTFDQAQERWDNMLPPDDFGQEPTEAQIEEAFSELVQDDERLNDFMLTSDVTICTVYQLYHAHGLPRCDGSERDDDLRDRYANEFTAFFDHYRAWLGDRLTDKADKIMQADMRAAREDAEEYAAECRAEAEEYPW